MSDVCYDLPEAVPDGISEGYSHVFVFSKHVVCDKMLVTLVKSRASAYPPPRLFPPALFSPLCFTTLSVLQANTTIP